MLTKIAFEWIKSNELYATENVFKGLDRNRAYLLKQKYKELGINIGKDANGIKADIVINDIRRNQPSIGQSIAKGYWRAIHFNSFL